MRKAATLTILCLLATILFGGCVTKVTPPAPRRACVHRVWVPGHYNAHGVWVAAHWRKTK